MTSTSCSIALNGEFSCEDTETRAESSPALVSSVSQAHDAPMMIGKNLRLEAKQFAMRD